MVTLDQARQRAVAQVKAATAKWNAANRLVERTNGTTDALKAGVERLEQLFEENQTDITRLLQARQRLIQLENARLDAIWQATQSQADLLTAVGAPSLMLSALQNQGTSPVLDFPDEAPPPPPTNPPPAPGR